MQQLNLFSPIDRIKEKRPYFDKNTNRRTTPKQSKLNNFVIEFTEEKIRKNFLGTRHMVHKARKPLRILPTKSSNEGFKRSNQCTYKPISLYIDTTVQDLDNVLQSINAKSCKKKD